MKLCRYDDDRLGVVIGDQSTTSPRRRPRSGNSTPYRRRSIRWCGAAEVGATRSTDGEGRARKPIAQVKLFAAGGQAAEDHGGADQLRQACRGDAEITATPFGPGAVLAGHREGRHLPQCPTLAGRPSEAFQCASRIAGTIIRPSSSSSSASRAATFEGKAWEYIAGYSLGST